MTKKDFKKIVADGLDRKKQFIIVKIRNSEHKQPEIIINGFENVKPKIDYYDWAYNEHMELISAKERGKYIVIEDVLMTSNLNDLTWFIY